MAVYTPVEPTTLDAFLKDYDLGAPIACEGILQGIENSNFRLDMTAGRFILTVFERRAARADLPYFLGLMDHLAGKGFPAPRPVRRRDGGLIGEIAGKPAAIVTFLEGAWPERPTPDHAESAGGALARLHLAAADMACGRRNDLGRPDWRPLFERSAPRADDVRPGLAADIRQTLDDLDARWPSGLPAGAGHLDLFPDNIFFDDGRVSGVIDFYFAATDAYAYDLAITLNAWCFRDGAWRSDMAAAMVAGYERARPLTAAEREALPLLLQGAAMRFLLTRLYDWLHPAPSGLVRPKDPLEQLACLNRHRSDPRL